MVFEKRRASEKLFTVFTKSDSEEQRSRIGNQTGGRVFLFLNTGNFRRDYKNMQKKGILFVRKPVVEKWGTVSVFKDLYGNRRDLIEPNKKL